MPHEYITAAMQYLNRKAQAEQPDGKLGNTAWFPAKEERRGCCSAVRVHFKFPWALLVHCRTLKHVARLNGLEEDELRIGLYMIKNLLPESLETIGVQACKVLKLKRMTDRNPIYASDIGRILKTLRAHNA